MLLVFLTFTIILKNRIYSWKRSRKVLFLFVFQIILVKTILMKRLSTSGGDLSCSIEIVGVRSYKYAYYRVCPKKV